MSLFGYPLREGEPAGVWRDFATAGPTAVNSVQIDWRGQSGSLVGHSGGPVCDPQTTAVVGVLVEGSERGRFDRYIPTGVLADRWPQLPRPWLFGGSDVVNATEHFRMRAHGQRSQARGGDLFRGRQAALGAVRDWLTLSEAPGSPLVVTGQPGAGKSAVVARAVMSLQSEQRAPGLAFHARSATPASLLQAVADLIGVDSADSTGELITALRGISGGPWPLVVDALDEVAVTGDRREMTRMISELAALPALRVVVSTRPLKARNDDGRYHHGELLPALGVGSSDSPHLVDLDSSRYFEADGVHAYVMALLTQSGAEEPGPPGHAWAGYRADPALCERLASRISERAERNYLIAAMAADPLSTMPSPLDPDDPRFDTAAIPTSIGEALDKYFDGLDGRRRTRVRGLLSALVYARGAGIDDSLWLGFARALGYDAAVEDLDELHDSAAADYLLQTAVSDHGVPLTRLFHQALIDELIQQRRHRLGDERAVLGVLRSGNWSQATDYARSYAADHAATCGELASLLQDPTYLAVADLTRLISLLPAEPDLPTAPIVRVLREAGLAANPLPPARRARLLALTAARNGLWELRHTLSGGGCDGVVPRWAHPLGSSHRLLTDYSGRASTLAVGRAAGRDTVVCGSTDGSLWIWDAATGERIHGPLTGHTNGVWAVTTGQIEGRDVVVSASMDGTVRVWDPVTGHPVGEPLEHPQQVCAVAVGSIGSRDVIVSSDFDTVRVWDAVTRQLLSDPITGHTDMVWAVALGRIGSRDVIVSTSEGVARRGGGSLRIWDARTGNAVAGPLAGHTLGVRAVACGRVNGQDVIVSGGEDGTVRVWDTATARPVGEPLAGPAGGTVALGRVDGRDVIVSGGAEGTVGVWDAATRSPLGAPLTGHGDSIRAVAVGQTEHGGVIVSSDGTGPVRIWALGPVLGEPLTGHRGPVTALTAARIAGRETVVTVSDDGTVGRWDALTGRPVAEPLVGYAGPFTDVTVCGSADGHEMIAASTSTGLLCVWDAASGEAVGYDSSNHSLAFLRDAAGTSVGYGSSARSLELFGETIITILVSADTPWVSCSWNAETRQASAHAGISERYCTYAVASGVSVSGEIIVSANWDGTLQGWHAATGQSLGGPIPAHADSVRAVAVGNGAGRHVIVSGGDDGVIRVWDAGDGAPLDECTGHTGPVLSVALGLCGGRDIIVSGGDDGTVRLWDLATSRLVNEPLPSHAGPVRSVTVGHSNGRDIVVSGGDDGLTRIWRPTGELLDEVDLLLPIRAVAVSQDALYIAAGLSTCAYSLASLK
ncbi:hypothetical protein ABZZ74_50320 [Streptomyces sp. NPDC006476]|uniref:hypothetical protein n=1 Tax=Streptomyces sp. NPDC006476 TaxID=3157175 RepID=UPI0033AE0308